MRKPIDTAVFVTLLLFVLGKATQGQHSTCVTSGTVFDGDPATVQCRFNRPHEKFMVYRLSTSSEKKEQIVLVCTHTENRPVCNNPDGHKVTILPAKDQATIHIPSARRENSGTYFCKTLPAWEDKAENCTLTVQSNTLRNGNLVSCKVNAPVALGQKSWLACEFSRNAGNTGITLVKWLDFGSAEEKILACDEDGQCEPKKAGYVIEEKTETHVRISIPQLRTEHMGHYKCKSATLKGISASCHLQTFQDQSDATYGESTHTVTYAILGCTVAVLTGLILCGSVFFMYKRLRICETTRNSQRNSVSKV